MQTRLVAILHADIAGFSRIMEADEGRALAALKDYKTNIWLPRIAENDGRVANTAGDAILVEFPSALAAVTAAIAIQRQMAAVQDDIPPEQRLALRIGVNLGDVVPDGADLHGDGVNVAARLQALAEPGGIAVSRAVHDMVAHRSDVAFFDGGEQQVKNIERAIHVFHVHVAGGEYQRQASVDRTRETAPTAKRWTFDRKQRRTVRRVILYVGLLVLAAVWMSRKIWPSG